jgi:peptidoglycan/xylan/chitin deacetylase (PgdA/CDA1 family)
MHLAISVKINQIRILGLLCLLSFMFVGCVEQGYAVLQNEPTITPTPSEMASEVRITPTDAPTSTPNKPTSTPTVEPVQAISTAEEPSAKRLPILEYHETSFTMSGNRVRMREQWFLEQMQWLNENGFGTLSPEQLIDFVNGNYLPPERSVVLTFDIGAAKFDEYNDVIVPALREFGFDALFFVLLNAITEDGEGNTISWEALRDWQSEGVISVQSHGVYHPDYQLLNFNQMLWDAETSFNKIEDEMGEAPKIFAFPFDSVPEKNLSLLMERAGYQLGIAGTRLERSVLPGDTGRYSLPRYYPYSNDDAYPYMSNMLGWTFPEMMLDAIRDPDEEPCVDQDTVRETPPMADPYTPRSLDNLLSYCSRNIPDKLFGLDQYAAFPSDISFCAQRSLGSDTIIKPTCNYGPAIIPEAIVLHFTYGPYLATVNEFRESDLESSAHYIIDRDGTITQMVPEVLSANHVTCYGNRAMCTEICPICEDDQGRLSEPKFRSIGVELVNVGRLRGEPGDFRNSDGSVFTGLVYEDDQISWGYRYWEDYTPAQIDALRILLIDLMQRWNIPLSHILGHGDIQINKIDPGPALNLTWNRTGIPGREPIFSKEFSLAEANCTVSLDANSIPALSPDGP